MNIGEIAASVTLDDQQFKTSVPRVESMLVRLDQSVARLANAMEHASGQTVRLGRATTETASSIGSTAAAVGKAAAAVGVAAVAINSSSLSVASAAGTFSKLGEVARDAGNKVKNAFSGTAPAMKSVGQQIQHGAKHLFNPFHIALLLVTEATKVTFKNVGNIIQDASRTMGLAILGFWGGFALTVGKNAIQVAGDMEVIKQRLVTLTGSMDAAKAKLHFFDELAAKSQYTVPTLVDAGTQLEVLGVRAEAMLPLVGDLAAAMGQDVTGMARAVGRALKGIPEGYEVLRNQAGITAEALAKAGAIMTDKGGLSLEGAAEKRAAAKALITVLQQTEGGMARKAEGIQGSLAKVENAFFRLNRAIGEALAPVVKSIALWGAEIINGVALWVEGLNKSGQDLIQWASSLSLGGLAISALGVAIGGLLTWLGGLAAAALGAASSVGMIAGVGALVAGALAAFIPGAAAVASVLGMVATAALVAKVAIVAIGVVVGGALLAAFAAGATAIAVFSVAWAKNWGGIQEKTAAAVAWIKNAILNGFDALVPFLARTWNTISATVVGAVEWAAEQLEPLVRAVSGFFTDNWPQIKDLAQDVFGFAGAAAQAGTKVIQWAMVQLVVAWNLAWGTIKDVAALVWPAINAALKSGLTALQTVMRFGMHALSGEWGKAWDALAEGVWAVGGHITVALHETLAAALRQVLSFVDSFGLAGGAIGQAIVDGIKMVEGNAELARRATSWGAVGSALKGATKGGGLDQKFQEALDAFRKLGERAPSTGSKGGGGSVFDFEKWKKEWLASVGGGADGTGGDDKKKKSQAPTPAEMRQYIRQHSDGGADLQGLTKEALAATYKLIQNSVREGIRLTLTSGRRYGTDGSHHNVGDALDVVVPGMPDGSHRAGAILKALAAGTGFVSGINEYLPEAREITGGTGPHGHLSTKVDGVGIPGFFRIEGKGGAVQQLEQSLEQLANRVEEMARDLVPGIFERRRVELGGKFDKLTAEAKEAGADQKTLDTIAALRKQSFEQLAQEELRANEDLSRKILEIRTSLTQDVKEQAIQAIHAEAAEKVRGLEDAAREYPAREKEISDAIVAVKAWETAEIERYEKQHRAESTRMWQSLLKEKQAFEDAAAQRRLEALQFDRTMNKITVDEQIAGIAQELAAWKGSDEQKRELQQQQLSLYREHLKQQLEEQGTFNQETLDQMLLALETSNLTLEEAMIRRAAILDLHRELDNARHQEQQQFIQGIENSFAQFLVQTLSNQASFGQTFQSLWKSLANTVISEIARMIVKTVAFQTILMGLRKLLGGIFGGIFHDGGVVGGDAGSALGGLVKVHTGGYVGPHGIERYHDGGFVGTMASMYGGGLRSDEVPAILQKGEVVLSRAQVRALRGSGGRRGNTLNVNVAPSMVQEVHPEQLGRVLGNEIRWAVQRS